MSGPYRQGYVMHDARTRHVVLQLHASDVLAPNTTIVQTQKRRAGGLLPWLMLVPLGLVSHSNTATKAANLTWLGVTEVTLVEDERVNACCTDGQSQAMK